MRTFKHLFLFLSPFLFLLSSCDKDKTIPDRTTHLVSLLNNTGATTGCSAASLSVTFIISYRDIQADVTVEADRRAILNVLVEDGEEINVKVQKTSDDSTIANTDIAVRTTSRPKELEDEFRTITYCNAFDLNFGNF